MRFRFAREIEFRRAGEAPVDGVAFLGGQAKAAVIDLRDQARADPVRPDLDPRVGRREDRRVLHELGDEVDDVAAALDEAAIAWTVIDDFYVYMGGTSMSGPHAAGAAAVFVQFYKSTHTNAVPSPALSPPADLPHRGAEEFRQDP